MHPIVIGIDPSSKKVAISITNGAEMEVVASVFPTTADVPQTALIAFRFVRNVVKQYSANGRKTYVFFEAPVLGRGGAHSTIKQSQIGGAMYAGAVSGGGEVHLVNNQAWKKNVCGTGNLGKPEIKKWIAKCWPAAYAMTGNDQDLIDAACIMKYGLGRVAILNRLEEQRKEEGNLEVVPLTTRKRK